jgi:hypothetical protein
MTISLLRIVGLQRHFSESYDFLGFIEGYAHKIIFL